MAASVFDSPLYAQLFPVGEAGRLFSDSAAIRAMLLVEGALARAQGQAGVIPEVSAAAIHRASLEVAIDPGALAAQTGTDGVPVPALLAAFRAEMNAPEHAQYVHWGATSQDIIDTGLMLRLRQALGLIETDLKALLSTLAESADAHADTVMAARTYGQHATPTSWGAVVAGFGAPLLDALDALPELRRRALWVSLSGAAGTASALGPDPDSLRAALADALGLQDPGRSWHTDRGPLLRVTDWMGQVTTALGAWAETLIALTATGIGEIHLAGAGGSSTMPQKQNPVTPSALAALARHQAGLRAAMPAAARHQHQRDGAAWFCEWMTVPQIVLSTASAVRMSCDMAKHASPDTARMRAALDAGSGLLFAETLSFALAALMPREAAKAATRQLCDRALAENRSLAELVRAAHPDLPPALFEPAGQLGRAAATARDFAARVRAL